MAIEYEHLNKVIHPEYLRDEIMARSKGIDLDILSIEQSNKRNNITPKKVPFWKPEPPLPPEKFWITYDFLKKSFKGVYVGRLVCHLRHQMNDILVRRVFVNIRNRDDEYSVSLSLNTEKGMHTRHMPHVKYADLNRPDNQARIYSYLLSHTLDDLTLRPDTPYVCPDK